MDKIAQRRGILNKLREGINAPGEWAAGKFSPEFTELMDELRLTDDAVREMAVDLKDYVRTARSKFNRREYMSAISLIGKYQEKLEDIVDSFSLLMEKFDKSNYELLMGGLDDDEKKHLFEELPQKFKAKKEKRQKLKEKKTSLNALLVKEADLKDWWHNIRNDRGRMLRSWEKRFPKYAKELKRELNKLLNKGDVLNNTLKSIFKTLASYRATRSLEEYLKTADSFVKKFNDYDLAFEEFYDKYVVPHAKELSEISTSPQETASNQKQIADMLDEDDDVPTPIRGGVDKTDPLGGGGGVKPEAAPFPKPDGFEDEEDPVDTPKVVKEPTSPASPKSPLEEELLNGTPKPISSKYPSVRPKSTPEILPPASLDSDPETSSQRSTKPKSDVVPRVHLLPAGTRSAPSGAAIPPGPMTQPGYRAVPTGRAIVPVEYPGSNEPFELVNRIPMSNEPFELVRRKGPDTMPMSSGPATDTDLDPPRLPSPPAIPRDFQEIVNREMHTEPAGSMAKRQKNIDNFGPMTFDEPELVTEKTPVTLRSPAPPSMRSASVDKFMTELVSLAHESPIVLANKVLKFAKEIEDTNPETSRKLLTIAQNILKKK